MIKKFPVARDVPDELLLKVGTIIAQWSYVEWLLRQIAYKLLDVDPKRGRIAIREPRAEQFITMFRQILQIDGTEEPKQFKELIPALRESKKYRDILAHGIWGIDPDSCDYAVQYTGGNWQPDPKSPKISRKITPVRMIVDMPVLEKISELITKTIDLTEECVNELIPEDEPAPDETLPDRSP